jgi:hypothetical protein
VLSPSFSLASSFFKTAWQAARSRWLGWSLFWSLFFISFNALLMLRPANLTGQIVLICLIQGGFPLFFLSMYTLNRRLETGEPKGWLSFFEWMKDKRTLKPAFALAAFHLVFYVCLAFASSLLGVALAQGKSQLGGLLVMFGIHFAIGLTFLSITWRMPALIVDGALFLPAAKQSLLSLKTHWKPLSWMMALMHVPTMACAYGLYVCVHGLQSLAAEGRVPSPAMLIPALLEHAPLGVHLVFWGLLFQFSFWMIVLCQGYAPAFWKKLPLPLDTSV